jgi:alkylhydroperoxidase family enzyme
VGLTEDQMRHVADEVLPSGVYDEAEAAIVRYAQKATRMEPIDNATYAALEKHFSPAQIIDICMTVGMSNVVNRFHATFLTDLDAETIAEVEAGDRIAGSCPIPRPARPQG